MKITLVRGGAFVATAALGLSLAAAPTASAAVVTPPAGTDPSPAAVGAAYLAAQPGPTNIIHTYYAGGPGFDAGDYDDYGLTIDAGNALAATGGQAPKLAALTGALRSNIDNYVFNGGSAAKMGAFLLSQGQTGTDVAGVVTTLESHVATDSNRVGRLQDNGNNDDFESPLTQGYAAQALAAAGSTRAGDALGFLLAQQCTAGFFRSGFSPKMLPAAQQTCDGAPTAATPSVDTTAFVVLDLQAQKATPTVAASLTRAGSWLLTQQAADGSFGDDNANTTGLAGWALGVSGNTAAAAKAASWLRDHQLADAGTCRPFAAKDNGAITLDDLGYKNASSGPLDQIDNSTATRATAQALPALLYAPGGDKSGETTVAPVTAHPYVKGGSRQGLTLSGAPGNTLCVTDGATSTRVVLPATGSVVFPVAIADVTGKTTVTVIDAGGEQDSYGFDVLGKKALKVHTAKRVERGTAAKIKVKGLQPKEKVRVLLGKKVVRRGHANSKGVFARSFPVNHKLGPVKLKVLGQFGSLRRDVKKIRVIR